MFDSLNPINFAISTFLSPAPYLNETIERSFSFSLFRDLIK